MFKEIRNGFGSGLLLGARYGALVGVVVGSILWAVFWSFEGFVFGGLLGLLYGLCSGAIIGGMMGLILKVNRLHPPRTFLGRLGSLETLIGAACGLLGGVIFSPGGAGVAASLLLGMVVALAVGFNQVTVPDTFAARVMSPPDLMFGRFVWGIFGAIVGLIVGSSIAGLSGGINGMLEGALVGVAIGYTRLHTPPGRINGPTERLP